MSLRVRKIVSLLMLAAWPVAMVVAGVSHDHTHGECVASCETATDGAAESHDHDHSHGHGPRHAHNGHSHCGAEVPGRPEADAETHGCDPQPEPFPFEHDCESCRFLGIPAIAIAVTVPPQMPERLEIRIAAAPTPVASAPPLQVAVRGPPVA